ncbi:MAG TPA: DUF362 domain-containing protein [Anaerolineaceae bacterium]
MPSSVSPKPYRVRAVACDYRSSDEEVFQSLKRAADPLDAAWSKLAGAQRIGIKFNQDWAPERVVMHQGHRQQLVSDPVVRATIRLLREHTTADLFVIDVGVEGPQPGDVNIAPVLRELDVPFINGHADPAVWTAVPGKGQMFDCYPVPRSCLEADAMVSVQKLKNHSFMGVTLCMKNLFGLMPLVHSGGRPRHYYHHLVRMPYMLADLGRIYNPVLNIIDGLVTQAGEEWGKGENPRICNTLVAGDQVVATDACAVRLMGHDPLADWPTPPFLRDRNALKVAAEGGFGTVDLNQIDFQSEVQAPVGAFFSKQWDSGSMVESWLRTTAEQALFYRDHRKALEGQYAGKYILLQMGEVRWSDPEGAIRMSRRILSGEHPEQGMYLKYVDPDEAEGEHYEVYEQTLSK